MSRTHGGFAAFTSTRNWRSHRTAVLGAALVALTTVACQSDSISAPEATENLSLSWGVPSDAFVDRAPPEPFGQYMGKTFIRLTGRFVGTTSRGAFRVPYELIVPERRTAGDRTVLIEPPHFGFGPVARDAYFGREFVFRRGLRYATVGWSTAQNSILDPTATDSFIADGAGGDDDEIVIQFIQALKADPHAQDVLGPIERYYGYGYSQTSFLLHRILRSPAGQGLLDFTMLNATWWQAAGFSGPFVPVTGVGKVIIVETEGDLVIADGAAFRSAESQSADYRVYEVAGGSHIPDVPGLHDTPAGPIIQGTNPTDWPAVARAAFAAGHAWIVEGVAPPASVAITAAGGGAVDPVYGFETGIARDADLNAVGGVRLPDLALGRGQFIASSFSAPIPGLLGAFVDLACALNPDGSPRFPSHGEYVLASGDIVRSLVGKRLLLRSDAEEMVRAAALSDVGSPGACTP